MVIEAARIGLRPGVSSRFNARIYARAGRAPAPARHCRTRSRRRPRYARLIAGHLGPPAGWTPSRSTLERDPALRMQTARPSSSSRSPTGSAKWRSCCPAAGRVDQLHPSEETARARLARPAAHKAHRVALSRVRPS
jgi:hypothetical protein